jgi:hypothetical protein
VIRVWNTGWVMSRRVTLVHERLTEIGGSERVVEQLSGRYAHLLPLLPAAMGALVCRMCVILAGQSTALASGDQTKPDAPAEIIVKVDAKHSVEDVTASYPVEVVRAFLASRRIYLLRSTDPHFSRNPNRVRELASKLSRSAAVDWAEPNLTMQPADTRFHAWPQGDPADAGDDSDVWYEQRAARSLRLADAHARSKGDGTIVAVLDTGVDADHPPCVAGSCRAGISSTTTRTRRRARSGHRQRHR